MKRCIIFLFALCFFSIGCLKESSESASSASASVSVYALVPNAPQLNFFLNSFNMATDVPFGSYTLYSSVDTGVVSFAGQTASGNQHFDTTFSVANQNYYSLFITGLSNAIKQTIVQDKLATLSSGYCGLRFFVFSPGVSNINFHVVKDSTVHAIGWPNRSFGDDATADSINTFTKFASGTYSFYVVRINSTDTLARFTDKTFSDSSNYTLMLEGYYNKATNDTTLQLGTRLH